MHDPSITYKVIERKQENAVSRPTFTFETFRMTSRDTKEAIYVRHPTNELAFLFLPKEALISCKRSKKPWHWWIEIPESLAEEKGLI